ncbi:glycogen synthase GlgA [Tateyamaria omphalii]|uniref:glycogen synthase GlgA n=1 Tax=Tateyamaria omphalii TaxID=299262 RepID=UPI001C994202|nr:glycogen synthase GlgA [Tateyamaria omphalii]MBY5934853.1 glycogen synthase GlgA [Tateyamaria omphalii]
MIRVLSVASECAPLVKTGGLADVVGALPGALAPLGVEMRTLLPGYPAVMEALEGAETAAEFTGLFGGDARLLSGAAGGLDLFVLDAPHLYDRVAGIYLNDDGVDWPDNPERFAALCRVAADVAAGALGTWRPDLVHCHDWQAGLVPYYMKRDGVDVPSVLTVHNIAFQGLVQMDAAKDLGIAKADLTREGVEYWGQISALKAGLVWADRLTTVSPTYARELMTPEFGMGLDGVLQMRKADLYGILNGIDLDVWSPEVDDHIQTYKAPKGKAANKAALRAEFGLPEADGPLCVVVSRLTEQKGLDLLLDALPALLDRGGQLALLGSGDPALEGAFASHAHPGVAVRIGYDEALSHRMMAGGDAILVPSRFEPCGLTQLYGLRYGTLPVVALTGGLADTVIPATPATMAKGVATGLQFHPVTADALSNALIQLCDLFAAPKLWSKMQRNAMAQPVGWAPSAAAYAALYDDLVKAAE